MVKIITYYLNSVKKWILLVFLTYFPRQIVERLQSLLACKNAPLGLKQTVPFIKMWYYGAVKMSALSIET